MKLAKGWGTKMGPYKGMRRAGSGDHVQMFVDLEPVLNFISTGHALHLSLQTKKYTGALFDAAFEEADEEFNVRAAAYAAATGSINHMYEWGTIGINKGRTNRRPSPMTPAARLWNTVSVGSGFDRTLTYYFMPSIANVPKPTTAETGISQEVIGKMRTHVFRWKSEIMEWGREITITPDKAKFLLIPVTDANSEFARPNDIKRGYMLSTGPITFQAGGNRYAQNFTHFWMHYWGSQGGEIINRSVQRQILLDFEPKFRKKIAKMGLMPAGKQNINARITKLTREIQKEVEAQAKARGARFKHS